MPDIKKIIKARANGLFLILLATLIFSGFSLNSHFAQSKDKQTSADNVQVPANEQILGEADANSEEITAIENQSADYPKENQKKDNNEITETTETKPDSDDALYSELSAHLKKYCGKNFNVKKCQDYLIDAKKARAKGSRFKALYKKYHFEKKEEKSATSIGNVDITDNKYSLVITSDGNSEKFAATVPSDINVIELMDLLQKDEKQDFSYHSSSGFVDKINGTENFGNYSWMLYACKDGACKLSSVGASDCKIGNWNNIEWRYLDWTTTDWTTW